MRFDKNVLFSFLFALSTSFSAAFAMNNNQITNVQDLDSNDLNIIIEEKVTAQYTRVSFYPKNYGDKNHSFPPRIAYFSYDLKDSSTVSLNYIQIGERKDRRNGLGKKLFTYFVLLIKARYPEITTIIWNAATLDSFHLSQENLEKWYIARGGIKVGPYHTGNGSLFRLNVKDFKPEKDVSALLELDLKENSTIRNDNIIRVYDKYNELVAKMEYSQYISPYYFNEKNETEYCISIKKFLIEPNYKNQMTNLQKLLNHKILTNIASKKLFKSKL